MRRVVALFHEEDARDELGLGTIRDAFANALFPGTSTIQTRLRYFLMIPWAYEKLERKRLTSPKVVTEARRLELSLIAPLKDSEDASGVIGAQAGESLQRLASSVYWSGLRAWGILAFDGSQAEYHDALSTIYRRRDDALKPDDDGVALEQFATWHPRLPKCPAGFPAGTTFKLTAPEAEFLSGRMASCDGSLLAYLAVNGGPSDTWAAWEGLTADRLPGPLYRKLDLARRFSLVAHGAQLLYNLMLAEKSGRSNATELVEKYRTALGSWANGREETDLRSWDAAELWRFVDSVGARVPTPTRAFVKAWGDRLLGIEPSAIADDGVARALVRDREQNLKTTRSRFGNVRALEQWGGASGSARLTYRWPVAQRLLNDLYAGLARKGTPDA